MLSGGTTKNSKNNIGVKWCPFVYFSTSDNNTPKKEFKKEFKKTFYTPKKEENIPKKTFNIPKKEEKLPKKEFKKEFKKTFNNIPKKEEKLPKKEFVWWNFSSPYGDEKPSDDHRENPYIPYSYLSPSVWRLRTGPLGSLLAFPNIDFKTRYGLKTKFYPDGYFVTKEYICRKIINCICKNGKKRRAYGIFNRFILELRNRNVFSPREYVTKAVLSLRPLATLRKNIVSGVVKKIPSSINMQSSVSVALNWFVRSARDRTERTMVERLVAECFDILSNRKCLSKNKKLEHYKIIHANRYLIYNKKDSHFKNKAVPAVIKPVLEKKVTTVVPCQRLNLIV